MGCLDTGQSASLLFEVSGRLEDKSIREASGLARSRRQDDVLWIINDSGAKELVHAIDSGGARQGEVDIKKAKNRDWEDLASFELDKTPYLMIADIGDNESKHPHRTLYFVEEPAAEKDAAAKFSWSLTFRYPDGPRDAESAAVDSASGKALILTKRDVPPLLYEVPLRTESAEPVKATFLGAVQSLPPPSRQDLKFAARKNSWWWQPSGMDISEDNRAAVILTYAAVYYFERRVDQSWLDALNSEPLRVSLGNFKNAEAIAFGDDLRTVFVTGENKHSRVLQVDLGGVVKQ